MVERQYDDEDDLSVQGDPPREFGEIRDRHRAVRDSDEDADDFVCMTPVDLAEALGGWAPEGEVGQDLQFFRLGGSPSNGTRKPNLGLAILIFASAAALIWIAVAAVVGAM